MQSEPRFPMNPRTCSLSVLALGLPMTLALVPPPAAAAAFISEPETLIYGRILNRENPNLEQRVVEGELRWTIRQADGSTIHLAGEIDVMDGGNYSYLLRVPHQALMIGQEASPLTLPLGLSPVAASSVTITVDGRPAGILPPASSELELDQLLRAGAWRLDLEINAPSADSDGDGMPDWWEDQHGLDKQDGDDALVDLNGNGLHNLGEYLAGSDPVRDPAEPELQTREVIAYAGASSIFLLETADADSAPADLVYTLESVPGSGALRLRNAAELPAETAPELGVGDTFTQADLNSGRLVFGASSPDEPGAFAVSVRDEDPAHPPSRGEILIRRFDPPSGMTAASPSESMRLEALRIARDHGALVADLGATSGRHQLAAPTAGLDAESSQQHAEAFGPELPHILIGGPADDILRGGVAADFIDGGAGADSLAGGAGADTFLVTGATAGDDVIEDFRPAEGDVLDLTGLLQGTSTSLADYVRIRRSGSDARVEISAAGTASGYDDAVILLRNTAIGPDDLADLYYDGNLRVDGVGLPPRVRVVAVGDAPSENGPVEGTFSILREGATEDSLIVQLELHGTATNGSDYPYVPPTIEIPAGAAGVEVIVRPYPDAVQEGAEVVLLRLVGSGDYLLAGESEAELIIEDLKPQLSVEVLDGIAAADVGSPGALLMRRQGLTSNEVFVRFSLSGTAANGIDYRAVTPYLTMAAGQTTRVIEFQPTEGVEFGGAEAKSIRMTITPDPAYALRVPSAMVALVPGELDYPGWLAASGLEEGGDGTADALRLRYGFGPGESGGAAAFPRPEVRDGHLVLSFRRKPAIGDYLYRVEYSNDFTTWFTGPDWAEDITFHVAPDDPAAAVYRSVKPISEADVAAMRVRLVPTSQATE